MDHPRELSMDAAQLIEEHAKGKRADPAVLASNTQLIRNDQGQLKIMAVFLDHRWLRRVATMIRVFPEIARRVVDLENQLALLQQTIDSVHRPHTSAAPEAPAQSSLS